MKELNRTAIFVAVALVLTAIAFFTRPSGDLLSPADMVGKLLFEDFEDPLVATSLEVVKYDEDMGTSETFRVAKIGTSWVIPSHDNYPADAEKQLAEAAAGLIGLEVLGVATDPKEAGIESDDMQGLHKAYGVVDPNSPDAGGEGVGTRVVMRDASDSQLVSLIIGDEVDSQRGLHYVRLVGQDPVYTVEVGTSKLSTQFEDWIEDDLLKLSGWDIRRVNIEDYSLDIVKGTMTPRGRITLDYDDTGDPRWALATDQVYGQTGWTDQGLAENEELSTDTLNALKSALDDLKIIDVVRKPAELSDTLKSGDLKLDRESQNSLASSGFHVVPLPDPTDPSKSYYDLKSNEGEIHAVMKSGVQYVLRFGKIASMNADAEAGEGEDAEGQKAEETAESGEDEESSSAKVNRYLFVMAQFDPSALEQPEYEPLPELPAEEEKPASEPKTEAAEDKPAEDKEAEDKEAEEEPSKSQQPGEEEDAVQEDAEGETAGDSEGEAEVEAETEEPAVEEEPKPTREEVEKQREAIRQENDRKKDEYEEKIAAGEEAVKELNARFADWYYVIADSEYEKIHLSRDKIVQEKKEEAEEGADAGGMQMPPMRMPGGELPASIGDFQNLMAEPPKEE